MLESTSQNPDLMMIPSQSQELNITEIFKVYFNQSSGNRDDFQTSLTAIIDERRLEPANQKLALLTEALRNIKQHDLSLESTNLDTSKAVKDSINKTLQCYKQYFLTKFSDDGDRENCDPDIKNILSNFNDTSNNPNDTTPNLLKSLTVRDSDKQALKELSRVLNNYLAGLVIETELKINNNDKLTDQKDNVDKIKNILGVFPGGVTNGVNEVQFACIGGSLERVEEAISVLNNQSLEVKSMQSAVDIFSAQIASRVEEDSQIHIKSCARGALMLDTSEVAKKDVHYALPQEDITLRKILEFCYNLANQVKKQINEPTENLNKIIIKYEALKEEEPIIYNKINEFTTEAKRLGFNITIDDILAKDANGNKYEFDLDGSLEKKSYLIDSDALKEKYSITIPSEQFQQELSKIERPEFDYLKHLLDPKKLFKDSSESGDEPSNRLDVKKIKNLLDLFPTKEAIEEASKLGEEAKNAQTSKMLAGLVTLRNILDGYDTNDNNYFYFLKFNKKFEEKTGKSFEDFFYENTNGERKIKAEFIQEKPILDTIASRIKHKRGLFQNEDEKLKKLIRTLVLLESDEKKDEIKKLFTQDPDILELKNASGENIAKILHQFSEEVLLTALEAKPELFEKITEKSNQSRPLLEIIIQRNEKELLLKILKKYQEAHIKEGDDGKKALSEMIFKQDLLFCFLLIDAGVGFPEAIIPMMNIDNLNNIISNNGDTILNWACKLHSLKAVQALIAGGVDLNKANKEDITPLQIACESGRLEIAQALIDAGADLNKVSIKGDTLLHLACRKGHPKVVQALIGAGADLNIANNEGKTPLHIACEYGYLDVVKALINKSAELNKTDHDSKMDYSSDSDGINELMAIDIINAGELIRYGETPLHIACKKNYLEVAQALIIAGAELNIVNNEGETPLEIAKKNNNHKIIQVLELKINKTPESDTQKRPKGEGLATPLERDPKRHKPGDGPAGGVGI